MTWLMEGFGSKGEKEKKNKKMKGFKQFSGWEIDKGEERIWREKTSPIWPPFYLPKLALMWTDLGESKILTSVIPNIPQTKNIVKA